MNIRSNAMILKIGENIKRLRKANGMTQEQLGELLCVSSAAVSKWESGDTYPDITMLFPLAHLFEISVDELMGYDAARTEAEIGGAINDYNLLCLKGRFGEASELIRKARTDYPNDYRIMHYYMWELAGGSADNDPAVLNNHSDEFLQICDCILGGCTDEYIRLEALTMKAKLLHAKGSTKEALELLRGFPTWYQSSGQKTEQLFPKDSAEFRYWVQKNLYELADFAADKAVKAVFFDNSMPIGEKVDRIESIGDALSELGEKTNEAVFAVIAKSLFGRLANDLTYRGGNVKDIIRTREKNLQAVKTITEKTKEDIVLFDVYKEAHGTDNLLTWTVECLRAVAGNPQSRISSNLDYIALLDKYAAEI